MIEAEPLSVTRGEIKLVSRHTFRVMLRHTPTVDSLWQEPARRIQPAALNSRKADRTEHVRLSRQAYRASAQILMARLQLFEIHDWSWCPKVVRHGLTDFLETSSDLLDTYEPIRTKLLEAVTQSGSSSVVDLCSGAGGPWVKWTKQGRARVPVTLTDKFPNATTVARLGDPPLATLQYHPKPIDATSVPSELKGFRTIFTAFHHFTPDQGKAIIDDAVRNHEGIGVFEFTSRTVAGTLGMLLTPLGVWLFTPMAKKVRWQVLALTYLVPVIPLVTCIDGILSCLRSYTAGELMSLAGSPEYEWVAGTEKKITYLIGIPKRRQSAHK